MLFFSKVNAQESDSNLNNTLKRKNVVDLTMGGTGFFISANYNRIIVIKNNYFINTSIGIGTIPFVGGLTFPHQVTLNYGKKSNFLEIGVGGTYWSGKSNSSGYSDNISSYNISPIIGFRKNFKNSLIFRAYLNPIVHVSGGYYIEDYSVIPYLGISIGYSF